MDNARIQGEDEQPPIQILHTTDKSTPPTTRKKKRRRDGTSEDNGGGGGGDDDDDDFVLATPTPADEQVQILHDDDGVVGDSSRDVDASPRMKKRYNTKGVAPRAQRRFQVTTTGAIDLTGRRGDRAPTRTADHVSLETVSLDASVGADERLPKSFVSDSSGDEGQGPDRCRIIRPLSTDDNETTTDGEIEAFERAHGNAQWRRDARRASIDASERTDQGTGDAHAEGYDKEQVEFMQTAHKICKESKHAMQIAGIALNSVVKFHIPLKTTVPHRERDRPFKFGIPIEAREGPYALTSTPIQDRLFYAMRDDFLAPICKLFLEHAASNDRSAKKSAQTLARWWFPYCALADVNPAKPTVEFVSSWLIWLGIGGCIADMTEILEDKSIASIPERIRIATESAMETEDGEGADIIRDAPTARRGAEPKPGRLAPGTIGQYLAILRKFIGIHCELDETPYNPVSHAMVQETLRMVKRNVCILALHKNTATTVPPPPSWFARILTLGLAHAAIAEASQFRFNDEHVTNISRYVDTDLDDIDTNNESGVNFATMYRLRSITIVLIAVYFCLRGGEVYALEMQNVVINRDAGNTRFDLEYEGGDPEYVGALGTMQIRHTRRRKTREAHRLPHDWITLPASPMTNRLIDVFDAYIKLRDAYCRIKRVEVPQRLFEIPSGCGSGVSDPKNWAGQTTNALKQCLKIVYCDEETAGGVFASHSLRKAGATYLKQTGFVHDWHICTIGGWAVNTTSLGYYIRPDSMAADGATATNWCRTLFSGYQEDIRPQVGDDPCVIYERKLFQMYENHMEAFGLGDTPAASESYYMKRGWRQTYNDQNVYEEIVTEREEVGARRFPPPMVRRVSTDVFHDTYDRVTDTDGDTDYEDASD